MLNKSKVLAATVAFSVVASTFATSVSASNYPDLGQAASWAQSSIQKATALGLMNGSTDGNFHPLDTVTRQEMATILVKALKLSTTGSAPRSFSDVTASDWGYKYINAVVRAGIMSGDASGTFRPNDPISREELAVVLVRALKANAVGGGANLTIDDKDAVSSWARDYVAAAIQLGLMQGDGKDFNPKSNTSRQEVAVISVRFVNVLSTFQPSPTPDPGNNGGGDTGGGGNGGDTGGGGSGDGTQISPVLSGEVTAMNPNEIRVQFGTSVTKASAEDISHYTLISTGHNIVSAQLQSDNRTVYLKLDTPFRNGDTYRVNVQGVLSSSYTTIAPYTDVAKVFNDTMVPHLQKAELVNNQVKLTFDKPVTDSMTVVLDGVVVANGTSTTVDASDNIHDYSILTPPISNPDLLTAGSHTVKVYNVTDTDTPANVQVMDTSYYTVGNAVAPRVSALTPRSKNTFAITFSDWLATDISSDNVTVKKGNYAFDIDVQPDTTDTSGKSYLVTILNGDDSLNPLYSGTSNSVSLSVHVTNYQSRANLIGSDYNGSVTLTRPSAPAIIGTGANTADDSSNALLIPFNESLQLPVKELVTVTQGSTQIPVNDVSIDNANPNVVRVTLGESLNKGSYSVHFAAGAVEDADLRSNAAVTTTVNYAPTVYLPIQAQATAGTVGVGEAGMVGNDKDIVTINYGTQMTTSALTRSYYTIDGHALPSNATVQWTDNTHTAVKIAFPANSFVNSSQSWFSISKNVVASNGSIVANQDGSVDGFFLTFTDNTPPKLQSAKYVITSTGLTTSDAIMLTFSENMGNPGDITDYMITINGSKRSFSVGNVTGKTVELLLDSTVSTTQSATIQVVAQGANNTFLNEINTTMDATDLAGNPLTGGTSVTTAGTVVQQ